MLNDATLFHFGYPTLMRSMYENDGAELIALLKKVKECGWATSLDLSAVDPDTEAGRTGIEKGLAEGARVSKYERCQAGEEIEFVFVPHKMHFFDCETENTIVL